MGVNTKLSRKKVPKGLTIVPSSELYSNTQSGMISGSTKTGLSWDRIEDIARYSPPVFSVIVTRIRQIVSLDWQIAPIVKEEDVLKNEIDNLYGLYLEYKDYPKGKSVSLQAMLKIKKLFPDVKDDLSNVYSCYDRKKKEIREKVRKDITEIRNFFTRPNREEDFSEFLHKVLWDLLVFGKSVIYKIPTVERSVTGSGFFSEMVTLKGSSVMPKRSKEVLSTEGFYQYPKDLFNESESIFFELDEIVYLQYLPTNYSINGLTPVEVVVQLVAEQLFYDSARVSEYEAGKPPDGILLVSHIDEESESDDVTMPLSTEQKEEVEDAINKPRKETESAKAESIKVLTGVDKAEFINFSRKEQDYKGLERQEWILKIVALAYNMAPQEIGLIEDVNRSTAEAQEQTERRKGIKPIIQELENKFTIDIIHAMGYKNYRFKFTSEQNRRAKAKIIKDEMSWKSINQIMAEEGYDPYPEKDYDRPPLPKSSSGKDDEESKQEE